MNLETPLGSLPCPPPPFSSFLKGWVPLFLWNTLNYK